MPSSPGGLSLHIEFYVIDDDVLFREQNKHSPFFVVSALRFSQPYQNPIFCGCAKMEMLFCGDSFFVQKISSEINE